MTTTEAKQNVDQCDKSRTAVAKFIYVFLYAGRGEEGDKDERHRGANQESHRIQIITTRLGKNG